MAPPEDMNPFAKPGFAEMYKRMSEQATAPFATSLLKQAGLDSGKNGDLVFLDSACGTAIVSAKLREMLKPDELEGLKLVCGDCEESMLALTRDLVEKEKWENVEVLNVDYEKTPFPDNHFTHVVIGFGVMMVEDPSIVMDEAHRILAPGGTFAISTWQYIGWVKLLNAVITRLSPSLANPTPEEFVHDFGKGAWEDTNWLTETFEKHGFSGTKVTTEARSMTYENQAMCVKMTTPLAGMLTKRIWTEEQRKEYMPKLEGAFTDYLKETYGEGGGVSVDMVACLTTARK